MAKKTDKPSDLVTLLIIIGLILFIIIGAALFFIAGVLMIWSRCFWGCNSILPSLPFILGFGSFFITIPASISALKSRGIEFYRK